MKNLAIILLIVAGILCATGAYVVVQESHLFRTPELSVQEILQIPLYLALFAWGVAVTYGSATVPDAFMARFARFSDRYEGAGVRGIFTVIGLAMVIYALVSLDTLLSLP